MPPHPSYHCSRCDLGDEKVEEKPTSPEKTRTSLLGDYVRAGYREASHVIHNYD